VPRSPRVLAALSDEKLVEHVRRGSEAAFEVIYDRHHRGILSFCRHMLASVDEAEDAVQQTFISAYDSMRSGSRDIKLKAWLYTIARNRCLSILRARRERPAELEEVPTAGLSDQVLQRSDLRELLADLRELPVEQRAALVLSEIGDLSHAEVGDVVGCELAKVKSLVFQARSSLIETRRAREIPCREIREQLATGSGGELRRGPLRRHLKTCEGCAEFRDEVRTQRRALAAILPVIPSIGLKNSALAAIGLGGGGGTGGLLAGGGASSVLGSTAAVKAVAVLVVAGVAVGTGIAVESKSSDPSADAAGGQRDVPAAVGLRDTAAGPGVLVHARPHARVTGVGRAGPTGGGPAGSRHAGNRGRGGHGGRGGRGSGPGAPGSDIAQGAPGTAPGFAGTGGNHAGGNGHSDGGKTHADHGRHLGWEIGVGNPHATGPGRATNPGGHTQPSHPSHSAPPTSHGGGSSGGGADDTSGGGKQDGGRSVGGGHVPRLPDAPAPRANVPAHGDVQP
jgi:RNA polymerase sigma factor (sigma-70 family)